MVYVLDAHGLLVFLENEPGSKKVESLFVDASSRDSPLLLSSVNFGEIYYIILRECGKEKAEAVEKVIHSLPIEIVTTDINLAREAAFLKAHFKMSYADCFAAALAKMHGAQVITGDPEFKAVEKEIKIFWV
ncbi:MAG: type II toxin-antitoxin system VapC family toxin [Spirochaetaceae bacterium]|nr:MAG: type II toxin-antitoxin system VapC family toxin [Spirochaetaceae bacterium]